MTPKPICFNILLGPLYIFVIDICESSEQCSKGSTGRSDLLR